jgi:hypothetical protein
MTKKTTNKKAGRPPANPETRAIKPNISLRRDLIEEATKAANLKGIGLSEYATLALIKQLGRDEILAELKTRDSKK